MAAIVPTLQDIRWGPERWQLFDYLAHPTRDIVGAGNPCIIFRHAGGGISGNYKDCWISAFSLNPLWTYLNSTARAVHFDIISIESAQRSHTDEAGAAPAIPRTKKAWKRDQVLDLKRGIASLKRWTQAVNNNTLYMVDPAKFISFGHSDGGSLVGLATLTPPLVGHGAQHNCFQGIYDPRGYDSTVRATVLSDAQVDVRLIGATNYMDPTLLPGWFGTRIDDANAEWNALPARMKESMSIRDYIERGDKQYYRPFFTLAIDQGAHTYPLANPHDSVQRTDLNTALSNAKLPYGTLLYNGVLSTDQMEQIYNWLVQQISVAGIAIDTPIPV